MCAGQLVGVHSAGVAGQRCHKPHEDCLDYWEKLGNFLFLGFFSFVVFSFLFRLHNCLVLVRSTIICMYLQSRFHVAHLVEMVRDLFEWCFGHYIACLSKWGSFFCLNITHISEKNHCFMP